MRYYDGLYRCDVELLRRVFHPDARYITVADGAYKNLDMPTYLAIIAQRESPSARGDPFERSIESIEIAGDCSICVFNCAMLGRRFIDYLTLIRTGGEWRIISKAFHAFPAS